MLLEMGNSCEYVNCLVKPMSVSIMLIPTSTLDVYSWPKSHAEEKERSVIMVDILLGYFSQEKKLYYSIFVVSLPFCFWHSFTVQYCYGSSIFEYE